MDFDKINKLLTESDDDFEQEYNDYSDKYDNILDEEKKKTFPWLENYERTKSGIEGFSIDFLFEDNMLLIYATVASEHECWNLTKDGIKKTVKDVFQGYPWISRQERNQEIDLLEDSFGGYMLQIQIVQASERSPNQIVAMIDNFLKRVEYVRKELT